VSHASSLSKRKIKEKKNKIVSVQASHNKQYGLIIEHGKFESFHFSKSHGFFNPPSLDLSPIGGLILYPKETRKYLGFIFNRKLSFQQHIFYYSNKALLTIKSIKILRNLTRELLPLQKQLLYRMYIMFITLYGFSLWFYN